MIRGCSVHQGDIINILVDIVIPVGEDIGKNLAILSIENPWKALKTWKMKKMRSPGKKNLRKMSWKNPGKLLKNTYKIMIEYFDK